MIRTKHVVSDINSIPPEWIFKYYLKLSENLKGQDIQITSIFNPKETRPSMFIYFDKEADKYLFKDYSTNRGGDALSLVKEIYDLKSKAQAAVKIIKDYSDYLKSGNKKFEVKDFKVEGKYKVKSINPRNWNKLDQSYWTKYNIDSKILEAYNIQPLDSYILEKEDTEKRLEIKAQFMYGYFNDKNELYKIYTPKLKKKFFKVKSYIQGLDQLKYDKPYLVICSSMKDLLALHKLGMKNIESIAPDSENTMLPDSLMNEFIQKYKKVCVLFDNDEAGLRAMQKYNQEYNIPYVHLKLEKDLSDSVEQHGVRNTMYHLYPLITKALTGEGKELPT